MQLSSFFVIDRKRLSETHLGNLTGTSLEFFYADGVTITVKQKKDLENDSVDFKSRLTEILESNPNYNFIFVTLNFGNAKKTLITLVNLHINNGGIDQKKSMDSKLTNREKELVKHLLEGKNTKEIADLMYITKSTVEGHKSNLMKKLGVKNTLGIVAYLMKFQVEL